MPFETAWYYWIEIISSIALLILNFLIILMNLPAFNWAKPRISSTFKSNKLDEDVWISFPLDI
jgi:hypothetical protein